MRIPPQYLRSILPAASLAVLLAAIFWLQPRTMSYFGLNLLLNLAVPIALATIAQMFLLCVNDLDLSIGAFVSLVACIAATWLNDTPVLGVLALAVLVAIYAGMGALIEIRQLPSIVVTLGMSFVWLGPGGDGAPHPGRRGAGLGADTDDPEALAGALPDHRLGRPRRRRPRRPDALVLRRRAARRRRQPALRRPRRLVDGAGQGDDVRSRRLFGVFSGIALIGLTTSADANIALRYTLLSIAGVILGGGEFVGGRVSPIGAVIGAMTLTLAGSFLSFLRLNPDWQIGAQGAILILVLALRVLISRAEARA